MFDQRPEGGEGLCKWISGPERSMQREKLEQLPEDRSIPGTFKDVKEAGWQKISEERRSETR